MPRPLSNHLSFSLYRPNFFPLSFPLFLHPFGEIGLSVVVTSRQSPLPQMDPGLSAVPPLPPREFDGNTVISINYSLRGCVCL